ncbi:MAG: peptide deformylase [Patescibacteria group bacterium]
MLEIKKNPNPILRKKCEPIKRIDDKVRFLAKEMLETMYKGHGVGLAGPQVGVSKNIFVIDAHKGPLVIINPEIVEFSENKKTMLEGCLSVPGTDIDIERPEKIKLVYQDETGQKKELSASGLTARVVQHEYDHLFGRLIVDYQGFWERLKGKNSKIITKKDNV